MHLNLVRTENPAYRHHHPHGHRHYLRSDLMHEPITSSTKNPSAYLHRETDEKLNQYL